METHCVSLPSKHVLTEALSLSTSYFALFEVLGSTRSSLEGAGDLG